MASSWKSPEWEIDGCKSRSSIFVVMSRISSVSSNQFSFYFIAYTQEHTMMMTMRKSTFYKKTKPFKGGDPGYHRLAEPFLSSKLSGFFLRLHIGARAWNRREDKGRELHTELSLCAKTLMTDSGRQRWLTLSRPSLVFPLDRVTPWPSYNAAYRQVWCEARLVLP